MARRLLIAALLFFLVETPAPASEPAPDNAAGDRSATEQESEAGDIIPEGGLTLSTQPITPVAALPARNPYDQGLEELALAQGLLAKGRMEAASDVSLQAYDDLMGAHVSRRKKKPRKKLLADRHQAATVYIQSSLAYIREYAQKAGGGPAAIEEAHARVWDLRDVSANYPELTKKVNQALQQYAPPTPAPAAH